MSTILTAAFQTIQRDSAICFPMLGNLTIDPPSYFTVFGFKVYFYGVIIALGFILGIVCFARASARASASRKTTCTTPSLVIIRRR